MSPLFDMKRFVSLSLLHRDGADLNWLLAKMDCNFSKLKDELEVLRLPIRAGQDSGAPGLRAILAASDVLVWQPLWYCQLTLVLINAPPRS